jgi:hypothetical protein
MLASRVCEVRINAIASNELSERPWRHRFGVDVRPDKRLNPAWEKLKEIILL